MSASSDPVQQPLMQEKFSQPAIKEGPSVVDEKKVARLNFINMTGKESSWDVDLRGTVSIPSPITNLPKPLALAYRNLNNHYAEHNFRFTKKGVEEPERVHVASHLVSGLLRHYFAAPQGKYSSDDKASSRYEVVKLAEPQPEHIIDGAPVYGTQYFLVLKNDEKMHELDEGIAMEPDGKRKDDRQSIHLLCAVVTDPGFLQLSARTRPTRLAISAEYIKHNGALQVNGKSAFRCPVVLLAGTWEPLMPHFEFYNFDAGRYLRGALVPWFGELREWPDGFDTNRFSLSVEHGKRVNDMFKAIVGCSLNKLGEMVSPDEEHYCTQPQPKPLVALSTPQVKPEVTKPARGRKRIKDSSLPRNKVRKLNDQMDVATQRWTEQVTEEYARTVRVNTVGRLMDDKTGNYLPKAKALAVQQLAQARGIALRGPRYTDGQTCE